MCTDNIVISGRILYAQSTSLSLYQGYPISKIVISGFFPIHFTKTFAGTENFHRYTGNIVMSRIVISGFHCNTRVPKCKAQSIFKQSNNLRMRCSWWVITRFPCNRCARSFFLLAILLCCTPYMGGRGGGRGCVWGRVCIRKCLHVLRRGLNVTGLAIKGTIFIT